MIFIVVVQNWLIIYIFDSKTLAKHFTNDLQGKFKAFYDHHLNFISKI